MILIINNNGKKLCQDDCWREFASFGDYPECVKTYRYLKAATNKAAKIKNAKVVKIPDDFNLDAASHVFDQNDNLTKTSLNNFVVWERKQ